MLPVGQHTLITQPDNDGVFKHCILVKLTESSAQAIEDYLKNKDTTNKRPSIVFQKDRGEISFPIESKSTDNSGYKKFHIAVSSVKEAMKQDTSASVECIAYADSKFKKLGTIESKVTVQAIKDEVFQATMEKVNNVKEEEKNNSTREIKHGAIVYPRQKQTPTSSMSASLNNLKAKTPTIDRPIRERIIHLLALKPYMKPEMILRLKKDNPLTERDIEHLDAIIQSVGQMNAKNQYELNYDIMINEVKDDWPFYSPQDKIVAKRNIMNFKAKQLKSTSSAFSSISKDEKKNSPLKSSMDASGKITPNFLKRNPMQRTSISPGSPDEKDLTANLGHKSARNEQKPDSYSDFKRLKPNGNISNQREEMKIPDVPNAHDFSKKYKAIQSKQQLRQYTLEFEQNHKEYSDLYEFLAPTAKQFDTYQKELEEIGDKNSKEATEKKDTILRVYFDKKSDSEFSKKRDRYDYLDMKLNFIKGLISQYKVKNETQNTNISPFSP